MPAVRKAPEPAPWASEAAGKVGLAWRPRPFAERCEFRLLPAGHTIAELVTVAFPDPLSWDGLAVVIAGRPYRRGLGEWAARPRAGCTVEVAPVPGDSGAMRIALSLAVIAAAVTTTALTGGALGPVWAGLLGAGISTIGMMAINALVPIEPPQQGTDKTSPHYSISGANNSARFNQPVRVVYGTHRVFPDLAAPWYTETVGDDMYLHGLLDVGWAPLAVSDWKIGATSFDQYEDLQYEVLDGVDGGVVQPSTLYPGSVVQDNLQGQSLRKAEGWVTRTTRPLTDWVSIDIGFPRGLYDTGKRTGDMLTADITFQARYRVAADDLGNPPGPWSAMTQWTESASNGSPTRRSRRFDLPARGTYDFSVQRITDDHDTGNDPNKIDASTWDALRSCNGDPPTTLPGVVRLAFRMRATKQAEGGVSTINCLASMVAPDWDPGSATWVPRATRSPAAAFRRALQGPGIQQPIADAGVDVPGLEDWAEACADAGWTCDFIEERDMGTLEVLKVLAGTGRASPTCPEGVWGVAVDIPKVASSQHYTPRNYKALRLRRMYVKLPHALRVTFVDRTQDYKTNVVRMVYADGYGSAEDVAADPSLQVATVIQDWQMPGVVEPDLIHRHGRKRLAEMRLRAATAEIDVEWEGWLTQRGQWIRVASDVVEYGLVSARVVSATVAGGQVTALLVDEPVTLDGATPMGVRMRLQDGTGWVAPLSTFAGTTTTLTLARPVDQAQGIDAHGASFTLGPLGGELLTVGVLGSETADYLVTGVRRARGFGATIEAVPLAPAVHAAENGPIPAWAPVLTPPAGSVAPAIYEVTSDESSLHHDAAGHPIVAAVVTFLRDGTQPLDRYDAVRLTWQDTSDGSPAQHQEWPAISSQVRLQNVREGDTYSIVAAYRLRAGGYGPPSATWLHQIVGASLPPQDPPDPYLAGDRVAVQYDDPSVDLAGFLWRTATAAGTDWADALPVTDGPTAQGYVLLSELPDGDLDVLVKPVRRSGLIESLNPGRVRLAGVVRPRAVDVFSEDIAAEGFPGDLTGCVVSGGVLTSLDTSAWLDPQAGPWLGPQDAPWLGGNFSGWTYVLRYLCPPGVRSTDRLRIDLTVTGDISLSFRWVSDTLVQVPRSAPLPPRASPLPPGWVPLGAQLSGGVAGASFRPYVNGLRPQPGQVVEIRFSATGGEFAPTISALRVVVESELFTWVEPNFQVLPGGSQLVMPAGTRLVSYVTAILYQPSPAAQIGPLDLTNPAGPVLIAYDAGNQTVAAACVATAGYA